MMGALSSPLLPPHVVVFPFMAQGHTIPLLDMSNELARRNVKVTIVTTPSNAPFITSKTSQCPTISLSIISFPTSEKLPQGCENVVNLPSQNLFATFVQATKKMKQQFERILEEITPICVISDMFLYWTQECCEKIKIPRIVSHGMGTLPMIILGDLKNVSNLDLDDPIHLPNVSLPFQLDRIDLPNPFWDDGSDEGRDEFSTIIQELHQENCKCFGVLVNSFQELEGEYVSSLSSSYQEHTKAWLVGPLLLYDTINGPKGESSASGPYVKWLDDRMSIMGRGSVMYVSFGSQAHLSDDQMDEIALALEKAGEPFMWVIRSKTWTAPVGWEERVEGRGLAVRDWVDQRRILAHPALGGFLSHCGWNSVLEGLSMGLPILAWPMGAEQPLNAKYVTMGLKVGLTIPRESMRTVHHDVICDGVKELLKGDAGKAAKERAQELGKMARQAVENGASSSTQLDDFIECLVLERNRSNV